MNKVLVRRAAPWLVAATALAIIPMEGAVAAQGASTGAASSSGNVSHLAIAHRVNSLSDLGASGASSASSTSNGGSAADAVQIPHRSSTSYRPSGSAGSSKAAAAPLTVPVVTPTAVHGTSSAVKSFNGINSYQERYAASNGNQFTVTPPDQGMCVGNGFVVESVNDAIRIFDKAGNALTPPIGLNAFYGYPPVINRTTGESGPEPTDPTCYYDPQYGRWFSVILTLDRDPSTGALTLNNHIDIAVSSTNDPRAGWVVYRIPVQDDGTQGTPKHTSCPCIGDYPHIGADKYGFYVTTNEYPWGSGPGQFGNNFNGAQVYALSKFSLAQNSGSVPLEHFSDLALANGTPSFTLWPSEVPGIAFDTRNNGTEWFSQSTAAFQETENAAGMSNNIAVWRLSNTTSIDASTPALTITSKTLTSEVYGVPAPSEQKVGPVPLRDCLLVACLPGVGPSRSEVEGYLDSNDSRMQSAWLQGGHLYTALDTIAQVNGRDQAGVAYFIVNVSGNLASSSISSQGYDAVVGNITFPSIATRADGTGVMALTLVGSSYYPSAAYMTVGPSGPTGSVIIATSGVGPDDEFCQYVFYNCAGTATPTIRPRWGDYGAAAVDGTQLWIASEFIDQTCTASQFATDPTCGHTRAPLSNWATRITQVTP